MVSESEVTRMEFCFTILTSALPVTRWWVPFRSNGWCCGKAIQSNKFLHRITASDYRIGLPHRITASDYRIGLPHRILKCEHSCDNVKKSEETVLSQHGRFEKCFRMFDEHLNLVGRCRDPDSLYPRCMHSLFSMFPMSGPLYYCCLPVPARMNQVS